MQKKLQIEDNKESIPISIFCNKKISGLEAIVLYLREIKKKSIKDISMILNRKSSTIYGTYRNAKKKFSGNLEFSEDSINIPYKFFYERKLSILESLVFYLKEKKNMTLKEISSSLKKNYNTIKTVYWRAKRK